MGRKIYAIFEQQMNLSVFWTNIYWNLRFLVKGENANNDDEPRTLCADVLLLLKNAPELIGLLLLLQQHSVYFILARNGFAKL